MLVLRTADMWKLNLLLRTNHSTSVEFCKTQACAVLQDWTVLVWNVWNFYRVFCVRVWACTTKCFSHKLITLKEVLNRSYPESLRMSPQSFFPPQSLTCCPLSDWCFLSQSLRYLAQLPLKPTMMDRKVFSCVFWKGGGKNIQEKIFLSWEEKLTRLLNTNVNCMIFPTLN